MLKVSFSVRCSSTRSMRSSLALAWLVSARAFASATPELVEFDFARELAVDADDDAVLGLEVLHFLVGVAGLLAQFADALFEPDAGAMGGLELGLKLVLDIGVGERVGDPCRLVAVERGVGDLLDVAASQSGDAQIVLYSGDHAAQHFVVRRLGLPAAS